MYEDEIEIAWRKIKRIWYGSENIEMDIPAFEEMEFAIKELIRIEKSWNGVNEASCRSSMDEYEEDY